MLFNQYHGAEVTYTIMHRAEITKSQAERIRDEIGEVTYGIISKSLHKGYLIGESIIGEDGWTFPCFLILTKEGKVHAVSTDDILEVKL